MIILIWVNELVGVKIVMIGMGIDMNFEVIWNVGLYIFVLDYVIIGDLLIVLDFDD